MSLTAEYIYLFGTMVTGFLLIGAGLALAYQRIKEAEPAVQTPTRLPAGIETMGRGVSFSKWVIECSTDKILEKLTAAMNTQNKTSECKLITSGGARSE